MSSFDFAFPNSTEWEDNIRHVARELRNYQYTFPWNNKSSAFESNLIAPQDVSVDAVVSSLYFNSIVFVFLMGSYELLRRLLPAVYSSRQRQLNTRIRTTLSPDIEPDAAGYLPEGESHDTDYEELNQAPSLTSLPDQRPLDWIGPVFGIPWQKVREKAGLDGYFFLR